MVGVINTRGTRMRAGLLLTNGEGFSDPGAAPPKAAASQVGAASKQPDFFYCVILIDVYVPLGTMSMLCVLMISLVAGSRSCFVTTSPNSGSSWAAVRRLSR